jgi:peroxiredoxin
MITQRPALEWQTSTWFNSEQPPTLQSLRGRVIVLYAFQMLCPGCAIHALPQAQRVHEYFDSHDVAVIGLHTVFEHHAAMRPEALAAFLHEYRYTFPVGVDLPQSGNPIPHTMAAYGLRGTPSLLLIDRAGTLRQQFFGRMDDLALGAQIMALVAESDTAIAQRKSTSSSVASNCSDDACTA